MTGRVAIVSWVLEAINIGSHQRTGRKWLSMITMERFVHIYFPLILNLIRKNPNPKWINERSSDSFHSSVSLLLRSRCPILFPNTLTMIENFQGDIIKICQRIKVSKFSWEIFLFVKSIIPWMDLYAEALTSLVENGALLQYMGLSKKNLH